jgi:hypothetical protein
MAMLAFSHCEKIKISFNLCDILCIKRHWFFQKNTTRMGGDYFEKPEGLDLDIPGRVGLAGATLYLRSFFIFSGLRYGMVLV